MPNLFPKYNNPLDLVTHIVSRLVVMLPKQVVCNLNMVKIVES